MHIYFYVRYVLVVTFPPFSSLLCPPLSCFVHVSFVLCCMHYVLLLVHVKYSPRHFTPWMTSTNTNRILRTEKRRIRTCIHCARGLFTTTANLYFRFFRRFLSRAELGFVCSDNEINTCSFHSVFGYYRSTYNDTVAVTGIAVDLSSSYY